jgi:UPF0288 family protein (methanogenesis marker protein 3)
LYPKRAWVIVVGVSTVRAGEVRFHLYPQDHEPRHAHGLIGHGQVIVDLRSDGTVTLAKRPDAVIGANKNEVRKVLHAAVAYYDELVAAWERMHG